MWELGNRGIIVLVSALTGCVFAYNSTVPILVLTVTITLILVSAYACYCLFVDDRSVSFPRHGIHQVVCFVQDAVRQLNEIVERIVILYFSTYLRNFRDVIRRFYNERVAARMQKPRSSIGYQLSTDACSPRSLSTRFGTIDKFSPIARLNAYESENTPPQNSVSQQSPAHPNRSFSKYTSTPLVPWKKDDSRNGDLTWNGRSCSKKTVPVSTQNHSGSFIGNSTYFSSDESAWAAGTNPKMRPKAAGVKTVQTTAGPLLASTRYNIDPKVYSDVISPGLTTRLSKYAMEANDKLTHQSQYGTGQFPRVNLNTSPVPLLNAKHSKARTPVMVRIAPPEATRYSPPERQKIISNTCLRDNKQQNVARVLREISLKRHASREDVASDLAKKQRTDTNVIENVEEVTQKRCREESSISGDAILLDKNNIRPTKRPKAPSCYDILNSLSSSVHVISGVKRKADLSRSGTPDFGKHFKSLDSPHSGDAQVRTRSPVGNANQCNKSSENSSNTISKKHTEQLQEDNTKKGILQSPNKDYMHEKREVITKVQVKEPVVPSKDVQLKDKLFMRAEPQKNEKLRMLVEEHTDVKAKFTTDDVEEIRKEDIVNMRQTSMRARLQSMFDAISGKTKSKINPDVVIQAEEVAVSTPLPTSSACATLNSSTTTTNINTSPISTSVIASAESTVKSAEKPGKHVTFNLPPAEGSIKPIGSIIASTNSKLISSSSAEIKSTAPSIQPNSQSIGNTTAIFSNIKASVAPTFTFDSTPKAEPPTTSLTKSLNTSSATTASPTSTFLMNDPKSTSTPANGAQLFNLKSQASNVGSTNLNTTTTIAPVNSSASSSIFGNTAITAIPSFGSKTNVTQEQNVFTTNASKPVTATMGNLSASTASITATTISKSATDAVTTSTSAPSTSLFTFTASSTPQTASFSVPQTTKSAGFTLGTSNTSSANIFGTVTTTQTAPMTASTTNAFSTTTAATAPTSTLNKSATSTFPSFGTTAASISGFSFGTNATTTTSNTKPTFSFNATSTSAPSATTSATPLFGTLPNPGATPSFGTTSTSNAQQFGATTTSVFGSAPSATPFGSQGLFSGITTTSSSAPSSFSTLKTTSATTFNTNTTPAFGTPTTTASYLFSNVNPDANTNTSTAKPPAFGTGSTTSIFGQTTAAPTFGTGASVFANASTSLFGTQTTASAFGTSNTATTTSSFGSSQNLPVFGAPNTGTTGVTASSAATTPAFGTSNPTPNSGFGTAANTPAFGTSAAQSTGGFGTPSTTSSTFGSQNAPGLNFGTVNNTSNAFGNDATSPFGAPQANTSSTPAFGASTSTPVFGTTGGNAANSTFTFGGSQTNAQQNTTFSFGGNTATSSAANTASTPFQFGASSSKPASTGFNFTAPSATPTINFGSTGSAPVFNAPTAGMFSIGSGSTAPRSRSTRPRKPR